MTVDRRETLRYMRMGSVQELDPMFESRLSCVEGEVAAAARPAHCSLAVPVARGEGSYCVGPLRLESAALLRELEGCGEAFLFCATLGAGVDALLRRYGAKSAADLVMGQAAATALLESYCDGCCEALAESVRREGRGDGLSMRFSPGYGDLPLDVQRPLFAALDVPRKIGVSLTDSLLMAPSKSVSAIIGIHAR